MKPKNEIDLVALKSILKKFCPNGQLYLAGKQNAGIRRVLMQVILGHKCTLAECGIDALENALYKLAGIDVNGKSYRQVERDFEAWLNS